MALKQNCDRWRQGTKRSWCGSTWRTGLDRLAVNLREGGPVNRNHQECLSLQDLQSFTFCVSALKDKAIRKPTDEFFGIWAKFLADIQTALKARYQSDPISQRLVCTPTESRHPKSRR